jgi:hypothetical protein
MRKWLLIIGLLLMPLTGMAQGTAAIQGNSYLGGTQSKTSGLNSSNYLQGIVPSATITVFLSGTTTKAMIFSNNTGTPLSNPFTSNAIGTLNPGGWIFFAAINQGYDIVASGGVAPNTYPAPFTLCTDCFPAQQIISGGVGQIIAGNNITISPTSGLGDVTINATTSNPNVYLSTTLSAAISSTATTIPLTSTTNMTPTGEIVIGGEWISYKGISGNSLTGASRGVHLTTPTAAVAGAGVLVIPLDLTNPSDPPTSFITSSIGSVPSSAVFNCPTSDQSSNAIFQIGCVNANETFFDPGGGIHQTGTSASNTFISPLGVGPGGGAAPIINSGNLFDATRQNNSTVAQGFQAGLATLVEAIQPPSIGAPAILNFAGTGTTTWSWECTGTDVDGHTFPGVVGSITDGPATIPSGGFFTVTCPYSAGAVTESLWRTAGPNTTGLLATGGQALESPDANNALSGTPPTGNSTIPKVCVGGNEVSCWVTSAEAPTAACTNGWFDTNLSASPTVLYQCIGNTWQAVGSGGGGSGVPSINGITGATTIAAGSNVTVTNSGNTITIGATGGGGGGNVDSVFGRIGAVTAETGDYTCAQVTGCPTTTPVSSVFGRTGAVTAQSGDYTVGQVTGAATSGVNSNITSLIGLTTPLSIAQGGTGNTAGVPVTSVFGRTGAITAQTGDYTAAQVSNAAATNASNSFTGTQTFGNIDVTGTCTGCNNGVSSINGSTGAQILAASGSGLSVATVGNTTTYTLAGAAGTGSVVAGTQFQDATYPSSGSTTTVGALTNRFTVPTGLSLSQLNTLFSGLSNSTINIQNGDAHTPFSNPNFVRVHDDRTDVPVDSVNIKEYGAQCDLTGAFASTTQGSSTITAFSGITFTAADVGKNLEFVGTDPTTGLKLRWDPVVTSFISGTQVSVSPSVAPFTVSGFSMEIGHRDDTAIAAAFSHFATTRPIEFPVGNCWSDTVSVFGQSFHGISSTESQLTGVAGDDVLSGTDPSGGNFHPMSPGMQVHDLAINFDPRINASQPWEDENATGTLTTHAATYRPAGIFTVWANYPLGPGWIQGPGVHNTGAINGVATTNGTTSITITSATVPVVGQQIVFPYASTGVFTTTVSTVSGSTVTLAAAYPPTGTLTQQEWMAGTSVQTIQTAIPATGRTFPMTLTLANPITPPLTPNVAGTGSNVAPYGLVRIGAEQCSYFGSSDYPASATATPSITLTACAQNGTTAAAHSVGATIVPLNPFQPTFPWPVTPSINSGAVTPTNASYFPAWNIGNAGWSQPWSNGTSSAAGYGLSFTNFHDLVIQIDPNSSGSGNPDEDFNGFQVQNATTGIYITALPFNATFKNIQIIDPQFGIFLAMPSINTFGLFGSSFPTANGANWENIRIQSAAYDFFTVGGQNDSKRDFQTFCQNFGETGNSWPSNPTGNFGCGAGWMWGGTYDDASGGGGTDTSTASLDNWYIEAEDGSQTGMQPGYEFNCGFVCGYNNIQPSGLVTFIEGTNNSFTNSRFNAFSALPIVNYGANTIMQFLQGVSNSGNSNVYGLGTFLGLGPNASVMGQANTDTGPFTNVVAGNTIAPVSGQTGDVFATGNDAAWYISPSSAIIYPDQITGLTWVQDDTAPISHSEATCSVGDGVGCTIEEFDGDGHIPIGKDQIIAAGEYVVHYAFETPQGANTFSFTLNAIDIGTGTCTTPSTILSTTVTTAGAGWQQFHSSPVSFATAQGCSLQLVLVGAPTTIPVETAYIAFAPVWTNITTQKITGSGSGPMTIAPTTTTIGALPTASSVSPGTYIVVSDFTGSGAACGSGGGTTLAIAMSNGSTWSCIAAGGGGGGGSASFTTQVLLTAAGSTTIAHGLSSMYPQATCYTTSGAQLTQANLTPVDANDITVTSPGATNSFCTFTATAAPVANFALSVSPTSMNFTISGSGTQTTPPYTVTQTALNGYTGTTTPTCTGLASGMSCAFSPTTMTGGTTSSLTLSFPATQATGTTNFIISATDGTLTHTTPAAITIADAVSGLPEQWLMHDGSGLTFADATPNGNTITCPSIAWGTGTHNPSPTFDGTTSNTCTAAQTAITNFTGTAPFSVSVWINVASIPTEETFLGNVGPSSSNFPGWGMAIEPSGALAFFLINSDPSSFLQVESSSDPISANTTTNLIVTYDGSGSTSGVQTFIGGTQTTMNIVANTLSGSTASGLPLQVGGSNNLSEFFTGSMSNLQIFSGVLTSGQITAIQTAGP